MWLLLFASSWGLLSGAWLFAIILHAKASFRSHMHHIFSWLRLSGFHWKLLWSCVLLLNAYSRTELGYFWRTIDKTYLLVLLIIYRLQLNLILILSSKAAFPTILIYIFYHSISFEGRNSLCIFFILESGYTILYFEKSSLVVQFHDMQLFLHLPKNWIVSLFIKIGLRRL